MLSFINAIVSRFEQKNLVAAADAAPDAISFTQKGTEMDDYFSRATDLAELENMQRNWDRAQRQANSFLF